MVVIDGYHGHCAVPASLHLVGRARSTWRGHKDAMSGEGEADVVELHARMARAR